MEIKISTTTGVTNIVTKRELVKSDNPVLKQNTPIFDFSKPPVDPIMIANQLIDALKETDGVGLAAPQIGYSYRVFVMGMGNEVVAFFNPEILEVSKETDYLQEGCLTFPDLWIKIRRPKTIHIKYQDYKGKYHEAHYSGLTARIFQHEYDHLNGMLFTDRAGKLALNISKNKFKKSKKQVAKS